MDFKFVEVAGLLVGLATGICFSSSAIAQDELVPQTDQPTTNSHWLHDSKSDCLVFYPWGTKTIVSVSWTGPCTDHLASGQGTLTITRTFASDVLTGAFDKGRMEGEGTIVSPEGVRLVGNFRNGLLNGDGTVTWPSGAHYEGRFVNHRFHGKGKFTWPNGDFYEGEYYYGFAQGEGKLTYSNGSTYEGRFEAGNLNGDADIRLSDGTHLRGNFTPPRGDADLQQPDFPTALLKPDQPVTLNLWIKVKKDGNTGDITFGESSGIAAFDKSASDAIARWRFAPATIEGAPLDYNISRVYIVYRTIRTWGQGGRYEGDVVNGAFQGQGKVTWPGGDTYVGSFRGGIENGRGVYTYVNGRVIDGNFHGGSVSGHAIIREPNGTRVEGEFIPPRFDPAFPMPEVQYPVTAARQGRTGGVTVRYTVGVDGAVRDAHILYYSGTAELDDEAIAEVFRTHMLPGTLNGKPYELDTLRKVVFQLRR